MDARRAAARSACMPIGRTRRQKVAACGAGLRPAFGREAGREACTTPPRSAFRPPRRKPAACGAAAFMPPRSVQPAAWRPPLHRYTTRRMDLPDLRLAIELAEAADEIT